jgi:hypothetical protein
MRYDEISFRPPGERRGVAELKTSPCNTLIFRRRFLGPYSQLESSILSKKLSTSPIIPPTGLPRVFTPVVTFVFAIPAWLTIVLADQAQCHRVSSALEAGTVRHLWHSTSMKLTYVIKIWINQYNVLYNNVPFGGKKQSGIGT